MAYENEDVEFLFLKFEDGMEKTILNLKSELLGFRIGRANPHILDKITVPCYGAESPLKDVANVSVSDARVLLINVWDKSLLKAVEKAILGANVGITPNNDGTFIRLIFPEVTEERRKMLVKDLKKLAENSKVALRNQRRDIIEQLKKMEKNSEITEDDLDRFLSDVEKKVAKAVEDIDKISEEKEKEIMSV